jgi:hypothetical protein
MLFSTSSNKLLPLFSAHPLKKKPPINVFPMSTQSPEGFGPVAMIFFKSTCSTCNPTYLQLWALWVPGKESWGRSKTGE